MEKTTLLRQIPRKPKIKQQARVAALCFALTFVVSLLVAWLALFDRALDIPEWVDHESAFCVRVQRERGAAIALMPIGTPLRILKTMIRFDKLVSEDDDSLALFADELLRSDTLRCDGSRVCTDAALVTKSATGNQQLSQIKFKYGTFYDPAFETARSVGAEGELALTRNSLIYLGKTHFCAKKNATALIADNVLIARLQEDSLVTNASRLGELKLFEDVPAAECSGLVELFPAASANEQTWLALTSSFLYESSLTKLRQRREVVEKSLSCSNNSETEIYELDCEMDDAATCRQLPSVPFRRISKTTVRATTTASTMSIAVSESGALARTDGALSIDDAVAFSVLRLCILVLVAFVVYARASRRASGAGHCLISTIRIAHGMSSSSTKFTSAFSDAIVGVLAMLAHFSMILFQGAVLVADEHADAIAWSSVGLGVSVVHFTLRNFVVTGSEHPVDRLGGSMALPNVSIATLLAFTKVPLLEASHNDFNSIARMFAGVLIAVFAIPKSLFAASSTAMLARVTAASREYDSNYPRVLNAASLLWLLQTASLAFALSRLFVVPAAYSLSRVSIGESRQFEAALLLGTLCLCIPVLNAAILRTRQEAASLALKQQ
jgi:hypothetical protein